MPPRDSTKTEISCRVGRGWVGCRLDPLQIAHGWQLESAAPPGLSYLIRRIPGEENQAGPCKQLGGLPLFNPLSTT